MNKQTKKKKENVANSFFSFRLVSEFFLKLNSVAGNNYNTKKTKCYLWRANISAIIYVTGKSKVRNFAHLVFANKNVASSQITMNDLKKTQTITLINKKS